MKKLYILFSLIFLTSVLFAQVNLPTINPQSLGHPIEYKSKKPVNNKTVTCTDTVEYPISKLTGLPEVDTLDIASYISGTAQVYYFSGTGTLDGIDAHVYLDLDGVPFNSTPIIMTIKVYNVNVDNEPSTLIDSADVQVMDVGFQAQALMFTTPVAISDTFAVALEINPLFPANPYYVTNTSANNDGNLEKLSSAEYLGVWYNAYDDFGAWDMDCLLSPIFTEDFTSSYIVDSNVACLGNCILFTNTTVPHDNPMFHPTPNDYLLDLGDGSQAALDTTYCHIYPAPGGYTTNLTATQYGHTNTCIDVTVVAVTVNDTAVANFGFSHLGSGQYAFSDSSSSANIYSWDFGDSTPLDSTINPTHTYSTPGNYEVCLTVTDSNGCNVNTFCDSVSFVLGVEDYEVISQVNIYPIPATKYFNVSVPNNYLDSEIIITDVVGKTLKKVRIENNEKIKILTNDISSGIYFVSIDKNGERVFTQRIVIDK